jgi:hypothetical protein
MKDLNFSNQKTNTVQRMFNDSPFFSGTQPREDAFFPPSNEVDSSRESAGNDDLTSPRFAGNARLEAAYDNAPVMKQGEMGEAVALVQETLVDDGFIMPKSTKPNGEMDGIFGSETFNTVWYFQDKHDVDTDGRVGHDTLDKLQSVTQENNDQKPDKDNKVCEGIKKFGKDFASAVDVVVNPVLPSAGPRDGKPSDILFKSGGTGDKPVFEINANASLGPFVLGDGQKFQHGVIQTTKIMSYKVDYSNSKKASRESVNSRDAEPGTAAPWVRKPPADGGPVPFLPGDSAGKGFRLIDMPRHFFPMVHPTDASATIQKITFKTVFDFWHVAKETSSDGGNADNLAFLSNFQITLDSNAEKSKVNDNFVGSQPNNKISKKIACGKGSATPVLDKPITIVDLDKMTT